MDSSITLCHEIYEGFEIEHCKRQEPINMNLYHYHSSYEIYYLLSGVRNYFIKDRTYRIEKGDVVLINRNDLHKTTYGGSSTHERILINLDESFIEDMMASIKDIDILKPFQEDIHVIKLNKTEQANIERILLNMMKEAKEKDIGEVTSIQLLTLELLIFVTRLAVRPGSAVKGHLNPMHEKISDIVKYINASYMNKITLQQIADQFFVSSCYLSRLFKSVTGFTFVEFLNSVRIKEAQRLLKESKLNIGVIAEKTGFESATHFGRVFKEITGFSPLRFRKINKVVLYR